MDTSDDSKHLRFSKSPGISNSASYQIGPDLLNFFQKDTRRNLSGIDKRERQLKYCSVCGYSCIGGASHTKYSSASKMPLATSAGLPFHPTSSRHYSPHAPSSRNPTTPQIPQQTLTKLVQDIIDLQIRSQMDKIKTHFQLNSKDLEVMIQRYLKQHTNQLDYKMKEMQRLLCQIKGVEKELDDKMKAMRDAQFEMKQENINFRTKIQSSVSTMVDNRSDLIEKMLNNKLLDIESRFGDMSSKLNDIKPELQLDVDQKIRRAKLSSGKESGSNAADFGKFDAVHSIVDKVMQKKLNNMQTDLQSEMENIESRIMQQQEHHYSRILLSQQKSGDTHQRRSKDMLQNVQLQRLKEAQTAISDAKKRQMQHQTKFVIQQEQQNKFQTDIFEIRSEMVGKIQEMNKEMGNKIALLEDRHKRIQSDKELHNARVQRQFGSIREDIKTLQQQINDLENQKQPQVMSPHQGPQLAAPNKDIKNLKQQIARLDAEFLHFKESQQNKNSQIDLQLSTLAESIPNTQDLQSRVLTRCTQQTRHSLATQSSKREQLSNKIHQLQSKSAATQSDINDVRVQISLAQDRLNQNSAKEEQLHKHFLEIKRELSTLQLLIKQKDYDNKIALLQNENLNLSAKYNEHDQQINQIKTLIQLNNNNNQAPQLSQPHSHAPRDNKAIQSILSTLNSHKHSIEKHQAHYQELNSIIDRIQALQAENVQILSLSSRVEGLEQLRNQLAQIRQALNAHQRIHKVEINQINEHAKNYQKDNRVEHESMIKRIIQLEKSIDLIQTKITHIDPLEEDVKLLRVKTRENATKIEEYAKNCRHNRVIVEKRIEEIQLFIDKNLEETNTNLDSNMRQFKNAVIDIDQRIDKLNLNQRKLRKKSSEQSRQFALMETFIAKKEESPNVLSVTKNYPNIKINSPSKVEGGEFQRRVVSIEEQSAEEAGIQFEESDEDAEIDDQDGDERATPGTPGKLQTKSMSSLPIASHSRDDTLSSSRYNFQMMQFHSPARYLRKTGPQHMKGRSIEMDNFPLGQKVSNYSEQNFRRSQYFNPDQAISYSIAKSQTPISHNAKYLQQSNTNLPSRDISSGRQSVDIFKTPLRPVSSTPTNVISKNYKVKDEQQMKQIINQEINDLLLQKQGRLSAQRDYVQDSTRYNREYQNDQNPSTRRSVSPVQMLKPLDQQSHMLRSFLSGQKIPQSNRRSIISGQSRDSVVTPQRRSLKKQYKRNQTSDSPSRLGQKYRGGDQKHQRCISGITYHSHKIFELKQQNDIWQQNREKKYRQHSNKYFENMIRMYNSGGGSQPSTGRFNNSNRFKLPARKQQEEFKNNIIEQSKLQQQQEMLNNLYIASKEKKYQNEQNQKFQYPDRLRSDGKFENLNLNKNFQDSGYESLKLGTTGDAVSAASRLTPMAADNIRQRSGLLQQQQILEDNRSNDIEIVDNDDSENDESRVMNYLINNDDVFEEDDKKQDEYQDYISGGGSKEGRRSTERRTNAFFNRRSSSAISAEDQKRNKGVKGEDLKIDDLQVKKLVVSDNL